MSTKGYGSITLTDVLDGAQIWTTTTAPTSPNYTFTISNLSGDSAAEIREGDLIFYSYYRYTVAEVGTTTVLATNQQSLRGANGAAGLNTATVYLYQRSNDQPGQPNFESTYTFSTKTLSGIPSGNKWSQTIDTGTNPVYMTFATASSTTDSDTIPASEWSNAVKLTGEDGVSGYNQATIFLYRRASSASKPTAKPTYTFATGALSAIPSGWSRTIPEDNGYPCWVTTTTAISRDASVAVGAWSDVQKLAEDGFTPTVTATRSGNTTTITITNSTGTSTTDIEDGERGATWYAGTAITGRSGTETAFPNSGVANAIIGDHYLNTSTQNVYVCTTPGTPSVAKWVYEQNIKGETGATGDKGYIHIKYSNDGGTTFTGNDGEDPGDWMGVYSDNTQADSTSVSAYQWVKIRGLSVEKIEKEYCLVNSDTAVPSGTTWSSTMPDYESGKWYWSREVTTWSDGSTTNGEAILEVATTEALHRASLGLGMKINYSSFSNTDPGEVYLHGYTNGEPADVNGFVYWKDVKRTVNKGMINPNTIVPYNRYIYIVLRLTNATATTGALRIVWYNSGWKYAIPPTPTKVEGGWEWIENRDVVLGQFIEPGPESDVVEAYLYNPPRSASQVVTTNASPYQYSQAAVEWNASYGGRVKNATDMLAEWAAGDFATTTEIDGGHIATNTIEAKHFVGDHIVSSNWHASDNESSPYTVTGTCLDLTTGNLMMPNFGIDNTYGKVYLNGGIYFLDGYIGNSENDNYWKVGTKVDYNRDQKAFLDGIGSVYIQTGEFMLSNGLLDTRHYDSQNKITYPVYDNTYWDFGIQSPILDSSTTGYVSGIDDNFIYIRKHANTIPSLKTDWDYIFRVDKNGMVYINGQSLDERYALKTSSSDYVLKNPSDGGTQTINSPLTVTGLITGTATQANQLTHWISINGTQWSGSSNTTIGTLGVGYGGTGATSFTSGAALIGNGSGAIQTRGIRNNTTQGALGWTSSSTDTTLVTTNTIAYWNGAYSGTSSNLEYVKLGKLGTVVTHDYDDFITVDGGIIDGSLQVTELTAGDLIVTGAARFTNGLLGDLIGNAATATKVNKDLIIKLASGTTEGTNMFTFNGSAAKTVDITKSAIGLGNVENTKLSTWAGSSNLTTAKVGTLAGAAVKAVDTSISAGSTSANLPTSAAVASFVEGKGYVTSSGVTSVRVQATSPVVSSVNTAQSSSLNTTISLADAYGDTKNPYGTKTVNYVLAGPASGSTAAAPSFRALVAADIPTLASSKVGLGNVTNNKQVKGLASGTTSGHLVSWGTDGYTVADTGIATGNVATKLTLAGSDYSASSNTITVTQANLQSAVQSTGLVLMTSAERSKLASIQVSEGGTIDFSGVTASSPLTATVSDDKKVNITHNTSGVSAGTYRSVTVNTYGHVTAGTNPTTLSGYGITDAKIASGVITLGSNTITPLTASSTLDATKLSGTASISTTGNAGTATKFSSARSITLTGDTKGSASADGSSGWSITTNTTTISGINSSGTAQSGTNSRPTTANTNYHDNKLRYYIASTSMETGKPSGDGHILHMAWDNSGWDSQLAVITSGPHIQIRSEDGSGNWGNWVTALDSVNYTDYTVKKDGTGATGTWGISISGNATTATSATSATSASSATKWTSAQTVYVTLGTASKTTTLQGGSSSAQTIGVDGTLAVGNGGTGKTTAKDAANSFIDALEAGSSVPLDGDTYIASYADGKNTAHNGTNTYHRRPISQLYSYIKGKTDTVYAKLSGATFTGAVTGTSFGASSYMSVNTGNSGTAGGLALYGTTPTSYGIAMRQTSNSGKHGFVQGDWAIYSYMSGADNRGWILKNSTSGSGVASVSQKGEVVFSGTLTVGGNTANTSGCRMEFNSTLNCLAFVFN